MIKLLLVEDDKLILETLEGDLMDEGYDVRSAANGDHAHKLLKDESFDVMVTDIIMPDREGISTILEARKLYPALKIIAMSGGGRAGVMNFLDMAKKSGADEIIKKPFRTPQLLEILRSFYPKPELV